MIVRYVFSRSSREVIVAGAAVSRKSVIKDEIGEPGKSSTIDSLSLGPIRALGFTDFFS